MNEFIAQFILESRELVEQAATALAALERSAGDAACLDAVFRAVHTLKGGAGIVNFTAMEQAVHAAEDVLSQARAGNLALTAELIGDSFACLDQVTRWLEAMEQSGELPTGAEAQAQKIILRIGRSVRGAGSMPPRVLPKTWAENLLAPNPHLRSAARTAVRFTPHSASFFQGEDPLALVASLPGLLWVGLEPVEAWPTLDALDPFECILVLSALTSAPSSSVEAHFQTHTHECEVCALGSSGSAGTEPGLSVSARKVLEAQLALLEALESRSFAGRLGSAGLVAENVLRHSGRGADADLIARATAQSLAERVPQSLQQAIAGVLVQRLAPASGTSEVSMRSETLPRTLRVDAERIDALVRITGELTVVKNAIGHAVNLAHLHDSSSHEALKNHHDVLDHLVSDLQSAVLGIRVLPLRTVLRRFPRLVREMSAQLGKPVNLVIEGDDTEADKAIVEMLFEPLLHVVRNAMDHGIESPQVRAQRNKTPTAVIRMHASRQGAHVLIDVHDDGGGVNVELVREVARKRGVESSKSIDAMTQTELLDLVFAAGFSTAATVTELSGRGVGMDAVRAAVARVGGRVSMESRTGEGAIVKFVLPFSVMMTHVMTVEAGGQLFGIPFDSVIETVCVPTATIADIGTARAIVRRNRTIPVLELATLLQVRQASPEEREAILVIASVAGQLIAVHVDRLGERMEVILKPLDGLLVDIPGITGTTILGNGRVLLVLDLAGVLQ